MKKPVFKQIVWGIDTSEPLDFQQNAQFVLGALSRAMPVDIFPAHVIGRLAEFKGTDFYEEAYRALAEKRMKQLSQNSDLPRLHEGELLVCTGHSVRQSVEKLTEYAGQKNADAILISTHSRGVVEKFFLGSFAETLLLQSEIPLITINPKTKVREKISKILFPTTFEERFRPGFEKALELCSLLDAKLTAFWREPFLPMLEISYELLQLLESESKARRKEADHYREMAERYRVHLEVWMDSKPGNVAESITSFASDGNFDLVAMNAKTSSFGPRIGSVCRKVVRNAQCPVWTFRTDDYIQGEIE